MDPTTALLLLMLALGTFGRNQLVTAAAAVALILRYLPYRWPLLVLERQGIAVGLTVLTLAVLAPLASGKVVVVDLLGALTRPTGLVAVAGGIVAAWVCARGVELLEVRPDVIVGLTIGSILGASFLRGIPVGPLFAAGIAALAIAALRL